MLLDASEYVLNRKASKTALIDKRINQILTYVVDCYLLFKSDNITFSKDEIGKISQEDYLRNVLVDRYLRKNKSLIQNSNTTDIRFSKESVETYEDYEGIKHSDKIDVYITDIALQNSWGRENDEVYYAMECKRITTISDTKKYIGDIKKFTDRKYTSNRLPFEGQIAFVEDSCLEYSKIVKNINSELNQHSTIITNSFLKKYKIHQTYKASYISKHIRNQTNNNFIINHLFFDYSNIILN